jgi:hypothetical protein
LILDKGLMKAYGTVDEIKAQTQTQTFEDAFVKLTGGRIEAKF